MLKQQTLHGRVYSTVHGKGGETGFLVRFNLKPKIFVEGVLIQVFKVLPITVVYVHMYIRVYVLRYSGVFILIQAFI